jgi:reductive dehalogenase
MDSEHHPEKEIDLSRRKFVTLGAASAVAGSTLLATLPSQVMAEASKGMTGKQPTSVANNIDSAVYQRFHQKDTAFCQALSGTFPQGGQALKMLGNTSSELGQRQLDKALSDSGWYIHQLIADGTSLSGPETVAYARDNEIARERYEFASPEEASHYIKKAARFLGADLVGITPYDERWTYASFYDHQKRQNIPPTLPFTPKSVIVLGFEMDYEAMTTAPSGISGAAVGQGYSEMAITGASLRKFITSIGYHVFATGNDVALNIPYAIAAGLGEAGRNGILVTYEYGPRVRLCKVFTEMDLACDHPVSFGVQHFCETCMLCSDACPGHAISKEKKPSFEINDECNNPGVKRWAIDAKKCLLAWGKTQSNCATCITSCPYNKPNFWHHRLVDKVNHMMPGSVHSVMREMDKLFGYGNSFDKKAVDHFWKS